MKSNAATGLLCLMGIICLPAGNLPGGDWPWMGGPQPTRSVSDPAFDPSRLAPKVAWRLKLGGDGGPAQIAVRDGRSISWTRTRT